MKIRWKILTAAVCGTMILTAALTGCGPRKEPVSAGSSASAPEEETLTVPVMLSYANEEYITSGDNSLDRMIRGVEAEITVPAGSDEAEEVEVLIDQLKTVPEGLEGAVTCVGDDFDIDGVDVHSGVAFVDLASVNEEVSMYEEQYFVYQISDSVIQSFDDISAVKFTVNGQEAESLAGYMDVSSAFTMDVIDAFDAGTSVDQDQAELGIVDENGDILE